MTYKYVYNLDFAVKPELTHQFEVNFGKVMEAHFKHKKGIGKKMSFHRIFVGGEDVITLSIPMESVGFMDTWEHTPELVIEYYGRDEGIKILTLYSEAMKSWRSYITKPYDPLIANVKNAIPCL